MLRRVIVGLLVAAALVLVVRLCTQAWLLLQGLHTSNATLYWAMGRAMLNGREIYEQIFENKPPGIFLLSALSLALTGGAALGNVLNAAIAVALPLAFAFVVWRRCAGMENVLRHAWGENAFLLGGMVILFAAAHGGGWETEYIGSFFAALYALSILPDRTAWKRIILQTALLLAAMGMKEPFLLITLASAALLCRSMRSFVEQWLLPMTCALLIGSTVLLLMGIADGYTGIYLPLMLTKRVGSSLALWTKAVALHRITAHLWAFSVPMALSAGTLLLGNIFLAFPLRERWKSILPLLVGLALTLLAIGAGGDYQTHHFVLIVPLLLVLFLRLHKEAIALSLIPLPQQSTIVITVLALPLMFFCFFSPIPRVRALLQALYEEEHILRGDAARIDAILDACAIPGYFFVQGLPIYGYTRHSPENYFLFAALEHTLRSSPAIVERTARNLAATPVLVLSKHGYTAHTISPEESAFAAIIQQYILDRFSQDPPPCAAALPRPLQHRLLFRTDPRDHTLPFTYGETALE